MAILIPSRDAVHAHTPFNRQLFDSPQPAGRKITAGFTYLQRIAKAGNYDVWFPEALKRRLEARLAAGQKIGSEHFPAQWAAVRQFELLQESGNHKIYDLDPSLLQRATLDLSRSMRAGGIRITVASLGYYEETTTGDELEILDTRLQERIANMIHMLYLDAQSDEENTQNDAKLATHAWDYRNELPHIGMVLGARDLFRPILDEERDTSKKRKGKKESSGGMSAVARKHKLAKQFFEILNTLPQSHILHDTAIGLQLPELNGENQWNYIASSDETLAAFNRVMGDLFDKFNGISLSRLHGSDGAYAETKASTFHMRGYGHPLRESDLQHYRNSSLALI